MIMVKKQKARIMGDLTKNSKQRNFQALWIKAKPMFLTYGFSVSPHPVHVSTANK